jgi:ABC-type nitrate/sulfonate/bicarbonate transport system substrate-binding protein
MLVVAACGDGGDAADDEGSGRTIIRFAFAPDPVWDYMNDTGMIVEWEEENNTRIVTSSTWDEFTFFAGGHGDIVSMATMELPVLETETGIKSVSFGKYNAQRSPMLRRADSTYNTLADVPAGSKICVASPVSNSGYWGIAMNELHGIDYRVGGGDYELIVNDHFVNPQNLLNGDCEAAVIIPEAAASYLRAGELELMYDGILPFQQYNQFSGSESEDMHVMSNLFTATEAFFDAEPEAIRAFLALWEDGIKAWDENKATIIETYPQHFAVEDPADVAFIQEFMEGGNDWFVDTVYLTEEWIESEKRVWEFQSNLNPDNPNYVEPGFPEPRFEVVEP